MAINFVTANTGEFYAPVINIFINPIEEYLSHSFKTNSCIESAVNVHFFHGPNYLSKINYSQNATHIFMSHGIACKNWRDYNKIQNFNYIFVSGPLWVDKYIKQGVDRKKILLNGYTKLDGIFQGKYIKQVGNKPKILYAPTHNLPGWTVSSGASSYPHFLPVLQSISNEFEVIISTHPANSNHFTLQELVDADLVISDCSSIIYEAWSLNKPVILLDWLVKNNIKNLYPNSIEDYIYSNKIGYHADNAGELNKLIDTALRDGNDKQVIDLIENIFPTKLRGHSGKLTAEILNNL